MKKILGLDLGSTSIGWAIVNEPENEQEKYQIIDMGVRIVPLSKDENDEFSKGNAISKNANRTLKRGARRGMHRYQMRKKELVAVLNILNMMPKEELFKLSAIELYGLRDKAVNEQITLEELGRILFHLNQKRGYKSNRKANNEEENAELNSSKEIADDEENVKKKTKKKGYLDLIADREQIIENTKQTIGQYFFQELNKNNFFRIKENIFMRKSYENEFDVIWKTQQKYYPEVLTDNNKNKIQNEIIFYHRPLKSQKGLVSVCEFEGKMFKDKRTDFSKEVFSGPKVAPKSSPLFQVSKIWQELNNIQITNFKAMKSRDINSSFESDVNSFNSQGKRELSLKEKQDLFDILNHGKKLTPNDVLKTLGYKSGFNEFKINLRNEKFMEENRTLSVIKKIFDKYDVNRDDLLQFKLETEVTGRVDKETGEMFHRIKESFEKEPLYQLWHLLYSVDDAETLEKTLIAKYQFTKEVAKALTKIDFNKDGYGNMSSRALRNILPHLILGMDYTDACNMAGYNHSDSITKEENETRELLDKLELYPKNSLRQPVVEKIINQVINLINDIIDESNGYVTKAERNAKNKFEIRVELARDLKQSAGERNDAFKRNNDQDKKHKAIVEELLPSLGSVSKRDIERYKLWTEFGGVSPYEPTKQISLTELFNKKDGVLYDIEHIIPKSRLFDDSFSNKTICPRKMNSGTDGKNQDTAYDYMKKQGDERFNEYIEFIKRNLYKKDGISKGKFNKLMMSLDKIPDDFISRQMQETRFISKEVRGLLESICRNVYASTGSVTSKLRNLWGWDDVLMNLQMDKYKAVGQTFMKEYTKNEQTHQVERILGWSKREDHRHHAIDALSVACTKQGFIQRINHLNAQHSRDEMFAEIKGADYKDKLSLLEKYLISKRPFNTADVEKEASKILISFKAGKRVATKSKNTIKIKGGKIQQTTLTPRGFLHKETVYGQIKQFEKLKLNTRFDRLNDIADENKKNQVAEHLAKFDNDSKKAFNTKELTKFEEQYNYNEVSVYKLEHVVKYKLSGDFKEKDIAFIVDKEVQRVVKAHLTKHGNNPKIAFNAENIVWMNKEKGVAIKSVRCKTGMGDLQPLHKNEKGELIDFVSTSNNHHIAIYRDMDGKLQENAVSFWDAFERKKIGFPVIVKDSKAVWDNILSSGFDNQSILKNLPKEDWEYITSMQQNEMFVFGMTMEDLKVAVDEKNYNLISKHLFRVQKIATTNYVFRHHLETKVDDKYFDEAKQIEVKNEMLSKKLSKSRDVRSLPNMTGIKVIVSKLGHISLAEGEKHLSISAKEKETA
ncbi:MAG: type II CRISPR RNA-guided endonuclease Cas9 [Bacteroidota bacterium]